jgi:AAA15 family ATPase/GTPase
MVKIVKIWAKNFRMLNDVEFELGSFNMLAGKNLTGKSTVFELINFVREFILYGLSTALDTLVSLESKIGVRFDKVCFRENKADLLKPIQIAFLIDCHSRMYRYEIQIGRNCLLSEPSIQFENLCIDDCSVRLDNQIIDKRALGPELEDGWLIKRIDRHAYYKGYPYSSPAPADSCLGMIAEDGDEWIDAVSIFKFIQSSKLLINPDSNSRIVNILSILIFEIGLLEKEDEVSFKEFLSIVGDAISIKIEGILFEDEVFPRRLKIKTKDRTFPINELSPDIIRMIYILALPYINPSELILINNLGDGLHPLTAQALYNAISSTQAQVLVISHSMPLLACADLSKSLIFTKMDDGSAKIESGTNYPASRRLVDVYTYGR